MNRLTFLGGLGGSLGSAVLAQPPTKDEEQKKVREELASLTKQIDTHREKERNEADSRKRAELQADLARWYNLRGTLWMELEEWQAALLDFSDSRRYYRLPEKYFITDNGWLEATLNYAEMHWRLGHFDDAVQYAKDARAKGKRTADADFILAQAYAALGDLSSAAVAASNCFVARSGDKTVDSKKLANTERLQGMIGYLQGELPLAQAHWQAAAARDGRFGTIDPFDPKQAALNGAIAKNPKDFTARLARIIYFRERAAFQQEEKRIRAKASTDRTPDEVALLRNSVGAAKGGYINLLNIRSPLPHSFEEAALLDLKVALNLQPKSNAVYFEWFVALTNYNRKAPKLSIKEGVIRQHPNLYFLLAAHYARQDPEVLYVMGAQSGGLVTPGTAVGFLSRGLLLAPTHPFADAARKLRDETVKKLPCATLPSPPPGSPKTALEWKERGNAFNAGGDWRNSLECYEKAVALDPKFADGYNNIGGVYQSIGCYDRAMEVLDKAIALAPQHRFAYLTRARVGVTVGGYDKVLADAERAATYGATPSAKAEASSVRAEALLRQFRADEALKAATEATTLDANNTGAWARRGIAELYLGKDAVSAFDRAGTNPYTRLLRCLAVILAVPEGGEVYPEQNGKGGWKALETEKISNEFDQMMLFILVWQESELAPKPGSTRARRLASFYHDIFLARNPAS